jgi:hypothetical protein
MMTAKPTKRNKELTGEYTKPITMAIPHSDTPANGSGDVATLTSCLLRPMLLGAGLCGAVRVRAAAGAAAYGQSRVACVEVCSVSARAEWGAAASGPAFRPGATTAGGRPGSGGRGGRECTCRVRVVGIGVRAAAALAGCGVRAAWAGVELK